MATFFGILKKLSFETHFVPFECLNCLLINYQGQLTNNVVYAINYIQECRTCNTVFIIV